MSLLTKWVILLNRTIYSLLESIEDLEKSTPIWTETQVESIFKKTNTSVLLNALCKASLKNVNSKSKHCNRYDSLKQFCVFLYFVGRRLLYETLQANLTNSTYHYYFK